MGHASPTTTAIYLDAVGIEERRFASDVVIPWTALVPGFTVPVPALDGAVLFTQQD